MKIFNGTVASVCALGCLVAAQAASNKDRVQQFAKLPNWSGVWELDIGAPPKDGGLTGEVDAGSLNNFVQSFTLPLNAEARAAYEKNYQALQNQPTSGTGGSGCKLPPMPTAMSFVGQYKFIVTPEETVIAQSANGVRHIYTDGRTHPSKDDLWPTLLGDSIGHWEGDTLVIDTVAATPLLMMPVKVPNGITALTLPVSNQARFSERIRMLDQNHLEDQLTMDDPLTFTAPWKQIRKYKRLTDFDRMTYENCAENERNPTVNGQVITTVR